MSYRARNIAIAGGLALLAVVFTSMYVRGYKDDVDLGTRLAHVLVAERDVAPGTPGADLRESGLKRTVVRRRDLAPDAVTSERAIAGLVATQPIYAGEQVTLKRFEPVVQQGVRAQLAGRQRAIQLAGDAEQVLAGTLKEGDRVDFLGSWNVPESRENHVSRVVLKNLLVLSAPGSDGGDGLTPGANTVSVQLRVTDRQAVKLFWMIRHGEWTLQLRPAVRAKASKARAVNAVSLFAEAVGGGR